MATMLVAGALLAGCGGESDEGAQPASNATGCEQPRTIDLAVQGNIIPTNVALVAEEIGIYDKYNLTVKTILTNSGANAVAGMQGGSVDVSLVGSDVFNANEKGADLIAVASTSNIGLWTYAAKPEIKSFEDMAGKRIAVAQVDSISATAIKLAAEQAGVDFSSVELIPSGATPDRYAALQGGRVDVAVLGAPYTEQAASEGFTALGFAAEGEEPAPLLSGVYAVNREWAEANEQDLVCFLAAHLDAVRWARNDANRDELVATSAKLMGDADPELVRQAWETALGSTQHLPLDGRVDEESMQAAMEAYVEFGSLSEMPELSEVIDNGYVERAAELVE